MKDIAASRLDNGAGSALQAALISELELEAPDSHQTMFQDSYLLGSFDLNLIQHSTAIGRSLGGERVEAVATSERRERLRMAWRRFTFAVTGGLIIILPMFILVQGRVPAKTLAVISTSSLLFAVGVAIFSQSEPESLLAVTSAYSAVLVSLNGNGSINLS